MFGYKALFVAVLAVAGVSAAPSQAKRQVNAACPNPGQDFKDDISCPSLQILGGVLSFQGDNVGQTSKNVLEEVNNLLTTQSNPVTNIISDLTDGTVAGLTNGVVSALKGFAATVPQLNPDCACNMVNCNSAIIDAQGQCNIGEASTSTPQACGQALYACAAFYSADQIAAMTDGCCTARNT